MKHKRHVVGIQHKAQKLEIIARIVSGLNFLFPLDVDNDFLLKIR